MVYFWTYAIRPTAHPTYSYYDGLLSAATGPLVCPSRGARPSSPSYAAKLGPENLLT